MAWVADAGGAVISSASARARMARASGWLDPVSSAAARVSRAEASRVPATTSVTTGLPAVKVPVLSKAIAVILPSVSSTAPPFISRPRRAPADRPAAMAAGVDMTRAQGQPISSTARPL